MKENRLPPVRQTPDNVGKGYRATRADWALWPATEKALSTTYYLAHFPEADQQYALAGLQMMFQTFDAEHAGKNVALEHLDHAAAHEVRYHALRGRVWRRPCSALATCWVNLVLERPERILDRHERALKRATSFKRDDGPRELAECLPVLPESNLPLNPFAEQARQALANRPKKAQKV